MIGKSMRPWLIVGLGVALALLLLVIIPQERAKSVTIQEQEPQPVVVGDDKLQLGINPEGNLGAPGGQSSTSDGTTKVVLRFVPTGNEAVTPCGAQESWGVADAGSGTFGYANGNDFYFPAKTNVNVTNFTADNSTARSAVNVSANGTSPSPTFRVIHDYQPSTSSNLYEALVTVENTGINPASDLRYRRVVDWDVEPTEFSEYVTISEGSLSELVFSSNDGFSDPNPLGQRTDSGATGSFTDSGPSDQGATFDFKLGSLGAGQKKTFKLFYGAAATEGAAISAVQKVGADVYSLAQPDTQNGATQGAPNTFVLAFLLTPKPPNASDDTAQTKEDTTTTVDVLSNDTDLNGDSLTVGRFTQPENGTVDCQDNGDCTYTPKENFSGDDTFTYVASDGSGESSPATVTVAVAPVNDPPQVNPDSATTKPGQSTTISVLDNDKDPENDQLAVADSTQPANGQVECTPAGECMYTPNAGFTGEDSFDYTASDGNGGTNTATVSVVVEEPPPPPETNITSGPKGLTNSATAAFAFSSDRQEVTYECRLDGAAFENCSSPKEYTSLAQGSHTFEVRAVDSLDQKDTTPAKRTFTVDTNAPTVNAPAENLISPSQLSTSRIPVRLNWSGSDDRSGIARYELQRNFNGGSFSNVSLANSVSSTRTINLAPANHRFRVRAQKAGNWSAWKAGPNFSLRAYQEGSRKVAYPVIYCGAVVGNDCPDNRWTRQAKASAYGGYVKHNNDRGAEATFTFTGRKVAWVSRKSRNSGRAKIYINGKHVKTVDLYSSKGKARQVLYTRSWNTSGTRTLKIEIAGKNRASGGRRVDIDAFLRID